MKKITAALFCACAVFAGCSTFDRNLEARKNLEKCTFEVTALEFVKLNGGGASPESADFNAETKKI